MDKDEVEFDLTDDAMLAAQEPAPDLAGRAESMLLANLPVDDEGPAAKRQRLACDC